MPKAKPKPKFVTRNVAKFLARLKESKPKYRSYVVYRGPSRINGEPIVAIATGMVEPSENDKTGPMIQIFIFADNGVVPSMNVKLGSDDSVCGTDECVFRAMVACYVNLAKSGNSPFRAMQRGNAGYYPGPEIFTNREVRFGAYGDPAALPLELVTEIALASGKWTGYTHQWRHEWAKPYSKFFMASCELAMDVRKAYSLGWLYYRVEFNGVDPTADPILDAQLPKEVVCPGREGGPVDSNGEAIQCFNCLLCHGDSEGMHLKRNRCNIVNPVHGLNGKNKTYGDVVAAKGGTVEVLATI